MQIAAQILIGIIAVLHLYIMYFEMFAWETTGRKIFRQFPKELFPATKVMAGNQGLYNGFLAAGLIWSLFIEEPNMKLYVSVFFTSCVFIAGVYGAMTASRRILFVQGLPALLALILLHL